MTRELVKKVKEVLNQIVTAMMKTMCKLEDFLSVHVLASILAEAGWHSIT